MFLRRTFSPCHVLLRVLSLSSPPSLGLSSLIFSLGDSQGVQGLEGVLGRRQVCSLLRHEIRRSALPVYGLSIGKVMMAYGAYHGDSMLR